MRRKAARPAPKTHAKKVARVRKDSSAAKPRKAASPSAGARAAGPPSENQIRKLDRDLLKLINERAAATKRALESSSHRHSTLLDLRNDDQLWDELETNNPGPLPPSAVRGVFRQIISAARQQVRTLRVAYLGPPYSFTHLAAVERFGESADLIPVSTIAAVFEEVNRGHASYGLVPIENSTDGRIVDTLDMFTRLPLRICGEVQLAVHHNLLSRCPRGEITEIYSKPQALSQCREWLARNMPHARTYEVTSTSTAAQLARDKHGVAAIASKQAAVQYGLDVIASNIEDNPKNITRFAVIGEDVAEPTGKDRTAILLQIPHKPGALSDALTVFKKGKINLTWIESFPLRGPEAGYLFFLDFEGHVKDNPVKRAMVDLESKAVRMEVLGSYPRSEPRE
ncbi:MAG TPA: prephenate dehydratase [Planctomycetaceae bacterium]|nr:prephenate dehydratase [Planctomycetaceae bacterium]